MELELMDYLKILWKHRWLIIALILVAGILGAVLSLMTTPVFEADTRILIVDPRSKQMSVLDVLSGMPKNQITNDVEILKSRTLLQEVARRTGLYAQPYSPEFKAFAGAISIEPVQETDLIDIRVQSTDKRKAVQVANTLVDSFIQYDLQGNQREARSARIFVDDQLDKVQSSLQKAEIALEDYKKKNHILDPVGESADLIQQLSALDREAATTKVDVRENEARLAEIRKQLGSEKEFIVATQTFSENPVIVQFRNQLAQLEIDLAAALEKYTDKHPTVIGIRAQIDEIKNRMKSEVDKILSEQTLSPNPTRQTLYQQALVLKVNELSGLERIKALNNAIREKESTYKSMPQKEMELARLVRDMTIQENTFIALKNKNQEFRIAENAKSPDIQVVDRAIVPETPVKPKKALNVLIAVLIALFAGSAISLLIEYMDTTVKSPEELEKLTGLPIIGQIPEDDQLAGDSNTYWKEPKKHRRRSKPSSTTDSSMQ